MKKTFKKSLSILMSVVLICSMAFSLQITTVIAEDAGTTDEVSFYENVSEAEFAEDDTITVLIEFDYPENDYDVRDTDNLESSQEQLRLLRASNRAYYTENNQEFIDDLDIEYDDMEVSAYSPYVFVTFDTWDEYTDARDDLIELSEDDKVKRVFAEETPVMEDEAITVNTSPSSATMTLDDAKKVIGVKNENGVNTTNYTGEGIRVGLIDSGSPDSIVNFPNGEIKGIRENVNVDGHPTLVASIIGGISGIAPDVELYFAGNFSKVAIEWLISDEINVNIINICVAVGTSNGLYKGYDAYTDYISRTNLVLFVKSAGNLGQSTGKITSPGLGLNVLTVGATNANNNIYYCSSYGEENAFLKKPTFVAPGENIIIPNIDGIFSGTSLSAPMVTGIVALLLEEYDFLVNYPDLLAAALINGSKHLPGQTEMWNKYSGFGLVNYVNTREILSEQRYETAIATQTQSTVLFETSTYLNSGKDLTYCFFAFSRQNITDYNFQDFTIGDFNTVITPAITLYEVQIFDPNGILIHTGESDNNVIVGRILNTTQSGNYYIRIYMSGTKQGVSSEYLSLVYSSDVHEHSYTHRYTNPKTFGHTCYCVCGGSMFEPHVFKEIFGEARTCAKCGYVE